MLNRKTKRRQHNMERLGSNLSHEWHVAINKYNGDKFGEDTYGKFMYEAKNLADEVPRLAVLFKMEREKKLPAIHKQCSMSPEEKVPDNHLKCCLGKRCDECPFLLALDSAKLTPEQIDTAKAWTCAAHIISKGGDVMGEGYILTVDDRMYWDNVYSSLAQGDEQQPKD